MFVWMSCSPISNVVSRSQGDERNTEAWSPARIDDMIQLRELRDSDSDLLFKWINTRELVLLSAPFREVSREVHDRWFKEIRSASDVRIFAIASESYDRAIGYCQLRKIDPVSRNAELQIRIGETSMHGKGAGTAAVEKLLSYGFDNLKLHRIYLQVFRSNVRAQRTYLKCGFAVEGVQREAVLIDDAFQDIILMGVLVDEQR
jgi:RimJ/RimL family protein N-acetyltransferase